ncbi:MAG: hypothetical protein JXP37_01495 [Coriobacteriia bacterium]|nr:hypothetical protein [Coriobacteriia bacterium]
MPELTPWVPVVPKMPDLPAEIPWPPDFDFGDGLSPWYNGNDGRPYCYNDFASRLMLLILAVARLREAAGLRPMYPPFDLRFMVATPTIVGIAALWLTTMWNTAVIGGGTPDPTWTALYSWTLTKSASAKAIAKEGEASAVSLAPYVYRTQRSAFEGNTGQAALTFNGSAWELMSAGAALHAWRKFATDSTYARIDITKGAVYNFLRYQTPAGLQTVAITGDTHTIGYTIDSNRVVTYTHNGSVLWSGTGKVYAQQSTTRVCTLFAQAPRSADAYLPAGNYAEAAASWSFANTDRLYQPSAYENYKMLDETAFNYGDTVVSQSAGSYSETVRYIDGDGDPVESSSPTPPISPLASTLECSIMQRWLGAVESVLWPLLRS